ncbi:hypothetical protein [Ornithobacterium rhinotracheale]|uniref:hypothetical protein n=1 Tax=Ornithobacterium rhinotracheale TaxID=28251 RepID=UPI0040358640
MFIAIVYSILFVIFGLYINEKRLQFLFLCRGFNDYSDDKFNVSGFSPIFKDGTSIYDLIKKLKNKDIDPKTIPAIRIVEKDGLIYTLDNRRLKVFQEAGIDIPYTKLDKIPESEMFKFTTKNEGKTIEIRKIK